MKQKVLIKLAGTDVYNKHIVQMYTINILK
jgi:hypothetical protein